MRRRDRKAPIGQDLAGSVSPSDLMDRVYRHQRHIYDATRKYFLLGRDHLIARLDPPAGGHVLELGCGTGRNLIAAARRYPQACFYGVDISSEMLVTARKNVAAAGLHDRIVLGQGDATRLDPAAALGLQRFERVFFSYSLSMIPPWQQALAHGAALVAPGGRLSLVDFGQQNELPAWFRRLLFAWLRQFHVSPPADLADAVVQTAVDLAAPFSFVALYRGYASYAELTRPR
jgi:S-adenosylmethionine-diacylgycerolhomoserine-N-methlytransferase